MKWSKQNPTEKRLKKTKSSSVRRVARNIMWPLFLLLLRLVTLVLNQILLRRKETTEKAKSNTESTKSAQKRTRLAKRALCYSVVNGVLCCMAGGIALFAGRQLCHTDGEPLWGYGTMLFLSLLSCLMFWNRCKWMRKATSLGYRVTDNPEDYSLERTTLFAWVLLFAVGWLQVKKKVPLSDLGLETVGGWIIALACWAPVVSIVGSSWGKLKATKPNGDKVAWPCRWSKVKGVKG